MRLRLAAVLAVSGAVASASSASSVHACSIQITSHRSDYRHARAVFVGEVLSVEERAVDVSARWAVRLRLETRWKGPKHRELTVWSDLGRTCDGPRFEVGERYLVYAYEPAEEDAPAEALEVPPFSRSRALEDERPERVSERRQLDHRWFRWRARLPL